MHEHEVKLIASVLMDKYLDSDWSLVVVEDISARTKKRGKVRLVGHCSWDRRTISLERRYLTNNDFKENLLTITHEIAHALSPEDFRHGPIWNGKWKEIWDLEKPKENTVV